MTRKSNPSQPFCGAWLTTKGGWTRQCKHRATVLIGHDHVVEGYHGLVEFLCGQHAAGLFYQPALPASIIGVARWNPARAENGWLWS